MARAKISKKEQTTEERLQTEKNSGLREIEVEIRFINDPSYYFQIGEKVVYGRLKECIVDDILYDGKVYGLKCIAIDHNYGKPIEYETYRVAAWQEIRPLGSGETYFAENQDVKMYFNNSTIDSLIHRHYHFGIDFDPDYQRGYVWDQDDKELLLDSVFKNIDIGKFVIVHLSVDELKSRGFSYEILDGKQRLITLIEFYENKISYRGKFYNDLSIEDRRVFEEHTISVAEVREIDRKNVLRYFLMLNRTGKSMDEGHLCKIENMMNQCE